MRATSRMCMALVLVSMAGIGVGQAGIINVPGDQPTIQAGINAASNGDEVVVATGTYHERIDFGGKAITVRSTDPDSAAVVAATIIDGDDGGSVVTFNDDEGSSSVLRGLTITDGSGVETGFGIAGGGVLCWESSPTIQRCVVTDNAAGYGAGVYTHDGSPVIEQNTVSGNSATWNGGGISITTYAGTTLRGNLIVGNSATYGGGINCYESSPVIVHNTVSGNSATYGGGIYQFGAGHLSLGDSIVSFSGSGGGIQRGVGSSSTAAIAYCDVYGNSGGNYLSLVDPTGANGNISADPLFVNAAGGDFHLKSQGGHWTSGGFVLDAVTSPCIDRGNPVSPFANEPVPNGNRVNMGNDGNTAEASKTPVPCVVAAKPRHVGALNTVPFSATFNVPMHRVSVQNAFSIYPLKTGGFSWVGKKLTFTPSTPWVPGRWYTVTIKKSARSAAGVSMAADFTWSFKTVAPAAPALVTAIAMGTPTGAQISVTLTAAADVQVRVLNISGREVAALPQQSLAAGTQTLLWNGRGNLGTLAPAGQYLVRVEARQEGGGQAQVLVPLRR